MREGNMVKNYSNKRRKISGEVIKHRRRTFNESLAFAAAFEVQI
jgi:hypothetical protein